MKQSARIAIDHLNIRMPQGFGRRANAIARATARQLSRLPVRTGVRLSTLVTPKVVLQGGETDAVIARRIARAIHRQIHIHQRKGDRHVD